MTWMTAPVLAWLVECDRCHRQATNPLPAAQRDFFTKEGGGWIDSLYLGGVLCPECGEQAEAARRERGAS